MSPSVTQGSLHQTALRQAVGKRIRQANNIKHWHGNVLEVRLTFGLFSILPVIFPCVVTHGTHFTSTIRNGIEHSVRVRVSRQRSRLASNPKRTGETREYRNPVKQVKKEIYVAPFLNASILTQPYFIQQHRLHEYISAPGNDHSPPHHLVPHCDR